MSARRHPFALGIGLLLVGLTGFAAPTAAQILGDANNDGSVTPADADLIADFAFGIGGAAPNLANSDVNGDGLVDMRDALAIGQAGVQPLVLLTYPSRNNLVVNDSPITVRGVALIQAGTSFNSLTVNGAPVTLNPDGSFAHALALTGGSNAIIAELTTTKIPMPSVVTQKNVTLHYLKVDNLSVDEGRPGQSVTINGAGFDPTAGNMFVFFYPGRPAAITSLSATAITVTIPNNVGALVPGTDGITVVRKAQNGDLVPIKQPAAFFPKRHQQIWNVNTVDPDSVKTEPECTAEGGDFSSGFCIRHIDMNPLIQAAGGLTGVANAPLPPDVTTPNPIPAMGGTADVDIRTGWFWYDYFYAADPFVSGAFPLLLGVTAADFTRVDVASGNYDVRTILDNRDPAPLIYLQNPVSGQQVQESEILVYGSVNNSSVTIENVTLGLSFTVGTAITYFQQLVPLAVGDNLIRVTAQDGQGRTAVREVTVKRIPLFELKYVLTDPQSGINLSTGSLFLKLNGTDIPRSELEFKDNDLGGAVFNPDDLSTIRRNITILYLPGINDLINGMNTTTATCQDNAGNTMLMNEEAMFDASY